MFSKIAESVKRFWGRERGFTLVEMVMVIAIIAILVAVAIPIYMSVTKNAAQKAHDMNLRMIDSAVQQYHFATDEFPADIDSLKSEEFLEEIPEIPALLRGKDEQLSGVSLESYYLDSDAPPLAGPVGRWEGYRSDGPYEETGT